MYIGGGYTYYDRDGSQRHSRGDFLLLADDASGNLYACVRTVAMQQLGNFMMGYANIGGKWRILSGAFGGDGLPKFRLAEGEDEALRTYFHQVPEDIAWGYWKSDQGSMLALRTWAKYRIDALRKEA